MGSDSASRERFRQFRLLLGGSSVSMLGSRMMTIAYPMLALRLTHSPVTAGWFGCAVIAPSVLVYLPAGVLVDRCRPRRVMLASEFGRGVAIVAVIALVVGFGRRSIPYLLVPAIFEECLGVVSSLAERRYVRLLARREGLASALASSEARVHVVVTLARPAAGLLFEISYILPFIGNLASFACSVAFLLYLKSRGIRLRTVIRQARLGSLRTLPKRAWKALAAPAVPSGGAGIVKIVADTWVAFRWICKDEFARVAIPLSASSSLIAQALIIVFLTRALPSHPAAWSQGMVL